MGNFSPRNVSQLLAGSNSVAAVADLADVGDYKIIPVVDPDAVTGGLANKGAKIIVMGATGPKVSDFIPVNAKYVSRNMEQGINKAVTATFVAPTDFANKTFRVTIDMHDHIGSMLNDRFISAYVACDADGNFLKDDGTSEAADLAKVLAQLEANLAATLKQNGNEFTVSSTATTITVTEVPEQHIVGVKDGMHNPWELTAGYIDSETLGGSYNAVSATLAVTPGKLDDFKQLLNVEWFNSGYDKDPYREAGFPYSFKADSNIVASGIQGGDVYGIFQFYKDRDATNIERQHRQLIVVGANAVDALIAALTATKA